MSECPTDLPDYDTVFAINGSKFHALPDDAKKLAMLWLLDKVKDMLLDKLDSNDHAYYRRKGLPAEL